MTSKSKPFPFNFCLGFIVGKEKSSPEIAAKRREGRGRTSVKIMTTNKRRRLFSHTYLP